MKTLSLSDFAFVVETSSANVSNMIAADNTPKFERGQRQAVLFEIEDVKKWIQREQERKIKEAKEEAEERLKRLSNF